jgi:3-hydroxyisobutyrate dehydrogenase-like beta-hydroxyacid dehydrogenase
MDSIDSVGVVGVGAIGGAIVPHLLEAFDVWAYDVDPDRCEVVRDAGATVADSPGELARETDCTLVFVGSIDGVETVADAVSEAVDKEHVLAIGDTLAPEDVEAVADRTPDHVRVADVPVCREESAAKAGTLLVLFGGERPLFEQLEPVLATFGDPEYVGDLGSGEVAKLANNTLLWAAIAANYEVLSLADTYDVDLDQVRDVAARASGDNYSLRNWETAYTKWAHADLDDVTAMARATDVSVPLTGLVAQLTPHLSADDLDEVR